MQTRIHQPNRLRQLVLATSVVAFAATGCANMSDTQKGTAVGAGVGALGGAAIGRNVGGTAIGAGVGALGGYVWSQYTQQKKANMEQATAGTGVMVSQTPDTQLKVNIPSDISFDTGSAVTKPEMRPILDQFANGLGSSCFLQPTHGRDGQRVVGVVEVRTADVSQREDPGGPSPTASAVDTLFGIRKCALSEKRCQVTTDGRRCQCKTLRQLACGGGAVLENRVDDALSG